MLPTHSSNSIHPADAIVSPATMKTLPLNHVSVATHYVIYAHTTPTKAAHNVEEIVSAQALHVIATMLIDITIIPH